MCHPDIESLITLSDYYINDEEMQEFPIVSGGSNGLPTLSWTMECECRLEI